MKKTIVILALLVCVFALFAGCSPAPASTTPTATLAPTATVAPTADAGSSASVATDEATLITAAGASGSWLIVLKADLTVTKDVVVEGGVQKDASTPGRILAFYNQDANYVRTATYTLTVPKITIKDPSTTLKGNIIGDVYVEAPNFALVGGKITGNVYFLDAATQGTFTLDKDSSVTGTQTIKK